MRKTKNISIGATFLFGLSFLSGLAAAQEVRIPTVAEQTKEIINVVKKYGSSIGCIEAEPTSKDIFAMTAFKTDADRMDAKFAVTWLGDIGCAGGSGTVSKNVAIVRIGAATTFYVDALESAPALELPIGRIERIVGATKDSLVIDANRHGENDANNFPSIRERFTLKQLGEGKWKVVEIKKMPAVQY